MKRIVIIVLGVLQAVAGYTQTAEQVVLAEAFTVTVTLPDSLLTQQPGDMLGPFALLQKSPEANKPGSYKLVLAAYDTGLLYLPGLRNGEVAAVRVTAPEPEKIKTFAPPKEPAFTLPTESPWWRIPLALTVAALILAFWLLRRRKKPATAVPHAIPGNGLGLLLQAKERWAAGSMNSLQLGEALVESLTHHYGIGARKSTKQLRQFIIGLHRLPAHHGLSATLADTDAWRFGKYTATPAQGKAAIDLLEELFRLRSPSEKTQPLS